MMRSLWSGVSGLNAHQVAMDVEANNIANVNTVGFKYSRTNFQNLLSQTVKSATAPQGTLGGKNSLQIGLGTSVSAVETMFKQGSIQNTDKNTDMAINGDGFFVVSGDGGKTYRYTRAGDFTFDANGNFVDPNGYIVQGWLADPETHNIDTAKGVQPISIPPGLTTPANPTSKIQIKANLNSGDHIKEMSGTRATVDPTDDINGLYDANGEKISLIPDEDNISFKVVNLKGDTITLTLTYGKSNNDHDKKFTTIKDLIDEINYTITHDSTGNLIEPQNERSIDYLIYLNGNGQIVDPQNNIKTEEELSSTNKILEDIFKSLNGSSTASGSIKAIQNSFIGADDVGELFNANGDAFNLEDGQGIKVSIDGLHENRKFVYRPQKGDSNSCGIANNEYLGDPVVTDSNEGMHWLYTENGERAGFSIIKDSQGNTLHNMAKFIVQDSSNNKETFKFLYGKDFYTISDLICVANIKFAQDTHINGKLHLDFENGQIKEIQADSNIKLDSVSVYKDSNENTDTTAMLKNMDSILKTLTDSNKGNASLIMKKRDTYYFHNIEDLVHIWQLALDDANNPYNDADAGDTPKGIVNINSDGKLQIKNTSPTSFNITISGYPNGKDNKLFSDAMSPINGTLAAGGIAASQAINAATHTTSIDVFDSLGSKHTLSLHFRKTHTSTGPNDPTVWKWYAEVPEPATLNQPAFGYIKFNSDGSVNTFNPPNLIFNPNNGANPGQSIQLDFGDIGKFNGITSFEAPSSTSGQTQDGYPGGDLENLVVDQTGTIIGVFTNGRSYSLAQVALAKFTNNEGLMSEGGTLFSASPNSGEPIIGTAGTGGRGSIQPSSLEMSNVDLSRSLTQLIVIQRGFQANSKTITTSDQMLNTLLQLKQ
jgi:flagellar hook protein FlgE